MISPISPTTPDKFRALCIRKPDLGRSLQRHRSPSSRRRRFRGVGKKLSTPAPPSLVNFSHAPEITEQTSVGAQPPNARFVTQKLSSARRSVHHRGVHLQAAAVAAALCGCCACGSSIWQLAFTRRLVPESGNFDVSLRGTASLPSKELTERHAAVRREYRGSRKNVLGELE